eukprot:scaffold131_cov335-Pavlova_lutheri.AAC.40
MKSFKRPGVAMTISTPYLMSRNCGPRDAPPYTQVFLMPDERPKRSASSLICTANSLVGARMSMVGPTRGSFFTFLMCTIPGNRYPQVLPLPVLAMATTSLPCMAHAQDWAWIGVGSVNPARLTSSMMSFGSPAASKVVYGSGHPCPSTFISCFLRPASPLAQWAALGWWAARTHRRILLHHILRIRCVPVGWRSRRPSWSAHVPSSSSSLLRSRVHSPFRRTKEILPWVKEVEASRPRQDDRTWSRSTADSNSTCIRCWDPTAKPKAAGASDRPFVAAAETWRRPASTTRSWRHSDGPERMKSERTSARQNQEERCRRRCEHCTGHETAKPQGRRRTRAAEDRGRNVGRRGRRKGGPLRGMGKRDPRERTVGAEER